MQVKINVRNQAPTTTTIGSMIGNNLNETKSPPSRYRGEKGEFADLTNTNKNTTASPPIRNNNNADNCYFAMAVGGHG